MPWKNTNSTMIGAWDYDSEMKVLHVRFRSTGEIYSFQGVPSDVAAGFEAAPSAGRYFNEAIKDRFSAI